MIKLSEYGETSLCVGVDTDGLEVRVYGGSGEYYSTFLPIKEAYHALGVIEELLIALTMKGKLQTPTKKLIWYSESEGGGRWYVGDLNLILDKDQLHYLNCRINKSTEWELFTFAGDRAVYHIHAMELADGSRWDAYNGWTS